MSCYIPKTAVELAHVKWAQIALFTLELTVMSPSPCSLETVKRC